MSRRGVLLGACLVERTFSRKGQVDQDEMSGTDPIAACDRLVPILERALALDVKDRPTTDDAIHAPLAAYALAQLRMRVRPALAPGWIASDPVHVALFGGTNTGKSTALNVLLGRDAAGMGIRARFSQHPEGYRVASLGDAWLDESGSRFAGYRRYRDEHPPRQSDDELRRDGYRPALAILDPERLPTPPFCPQVSTAAVVWDGPDFSTEEAGTYIGTVIDLLALADLVLMMVTDESYADDRGNALLRMVNDSGVALRVVANKLPESATLLDDMTRTLEKAGNNRASALFRLPEVRGTSPADRLGRLLGTSEANTFRAAVGREVARGKELKRKALLGSVDFLERHFETILRPLAAEAGVADEWAGTVERLAEERILVPYRTEYLEGVRYEEFNKAFVKVVDLLQVPGVGPVVVVVGRLVRAPMRWLGGWVGKVLGTTAEVPKEAPEEEVLRKALGSWLGAVKAEAQARAAASPQSSWAEIAREIEAPRFREGLFARFDRDFAAYRGEIDQEVRRQAERIYEKLRESPRRLNALRGANLFAGATSVVLALKTVGLSWSDAVVGPVVAGLWHNLLEWGLGRYLEGRRLDLVERQFRGVRTLVATGLEQPVRELFRGAVSARDLAASREDFAVVRAEATRVAEGGEG